MPQIDSWLPYLPLHTILQTIEDEKTRHLTDSETGDAATASAMPSSTTQHAGEAVAEAVAEAAKEGMCVPAALQLSHQY